MCGIVGAMHWDAPPLARASLERMTAALAHRGPEGVGIAQRADGGGHVSLGHTRLRVIDLSDAANQPMANDAGTMWLVFNGELYNYQALRERLMAGGARFRTSSDTEVLLRLYEAEGEPGLEQLDGMFAFGIWDAIRRCLVLGRDRVGKKPLCYAVRPGLITFASEAKALLRHPEVSAELDEQALPALFLYGYAPTPQTVYRGIAKLPPGCLMTITARGDRTLRQYWDVPLPEPQPTVPEDASRAAARLRTLMTEAVQRRLIADVPLGAFLSGGLDSSIVVGVMSGLAREPVRTFSIGFAGDPQFDETSYARLVADHFRTRHTEFIVQPSAVQLLERLVWHYDGPFADSSAIPTYLLSKLTKEHVTVALTGDGGDELFAGYLRFAATLYSERVPAWIRHGAHRVLSTLPEWGNHRSRFRQLQKFAAGASLPCADRLIRWVSVCYEDLPKLLPSQRALRPRRPGALDALEPHLARCAHASPLSRLLYLNLKTYLLDDLLVKMDRCSMAHALEARSPFLDRALLEYAFSLPDALKLRGFTTKALLRQAFAPMLPKAVLGRRKMGFGVPLRRWFAGELRAFVHDALLSRGARAGRYVDLAYVRQLYDAHVSGRADHAHRLWTLLTFEVWLRNLTLEEPAVPGMRVETSEESSLVARPSSLVLASGAGPPPTGSTS